MKMYIRNLQILVLRMNKGKIKMKPIVFYDFERVYQNEITIKKDKFEKLLKDVYNAGFEDGQARINYPYVTMNPNKIDDTFTCKTNDKLDDISMAPYSSQL